MRCASLLLLPLEVYEKLKSLFQTPPVLLFSGRCGQHQVINTDRVLSKRISASIYRLSQIDTHEKLLGENVALLRPDSCLPVGSAFCPVHVRVVFPVLVEDRVHVDVQPIFGGLGTHRETAKPVRARTGRNQKTHGPPLQKSGIGIFNLRC